MDRVRTIAAITQQIATLKANADAGNGGASLNLEYISSRGFVTASDLEAASDDELADLIESLERFLA